MMNQLIELVQSYQDTINSTRETFSSSISLQTNDVMRILTIFSTIILPLSLLISILSLQGFDLNNLTTIPKYFYFLVVLVFGITFISLLYFGKKDGYFLKILPWVNNLICYLKTNKTILIIINNKIF